MNKDMRLGVSNGIKVMAALLAAITVVTGIMLVSETCKITRVSEELLELDEKHNSYVSAGQQLLEESDYLTECVRHYVVLGEHRYMDEYFARSEGSMRGEKAMGVVEELSDDFGTTTELVKAINKSTKLTDSEYRAIMLTALASGLSREELPEELVYYELTAYEEELSNEEKLEEARKLVFSDAYDRDRQDIIDKVNLFTLSSINAISASYANIHCSLDLSYKFQHILTGVFIILLFLTIYLMLKQNQLTNSKSEEIKQLNSKLTEQNKELEVLDKDAKVAEEAKKEFLSRMSYDIRTPINRIIESSELAKRSAADSERVLEALNNIDDDSQYLLLLVNNVLDMERIDRGLASLKTNPMNIRNFMDNLCSYAKEKLSSAGLVFIQEISSIAHPNIVADEMHLRQVLLNIIENSIKFTPKNGRVTIRMYEGEYTDGMVRLSFEVEDTGIGMSEQFLSHLFEPFAMEKAEAGTAGGVGIGLSISKHYIDLMEGHIEVKSAPKVGSRFIITVPFEEYRNDAEEQTASDNRRLAGMNILLVEDNDYSMEITRELLMEEGANVIVAENGEIAVSLFASSAENHIGAVLMDVTMPVMDGITAAGNMRMLKRNDALTVPIIMMAGSLNDAEADSQQAAGVSGYVVKPVDINSVVNKIMECVLANKNILSEQLERALKDANTDALTGIKNRNAFELMTSNIDSDIAAGDKPEFAIVLCDINGLKYANDNVGHEAGDSLLINSCKLICRIFAHSPVFRIGGDEFTAVLRGDDYANRDSLMSGIYSTMTADTFTPGDVNNVSFSAGIAVFDPDFDRDCDDVLRRADEEMYRHKKRIKGDDVR